MYVLLDLGQPLSFDISMVSCLDQCYSRSFPECRRVEDVLVTTLCSSSACPLLGLPVIVGMSINIASIDSISEVNMVSGQPSPFPHPHASISLTLLFQYFVKYIEYIFCTLANCCCFLNVLDKYIYITLINFDLNTRKPHQLQR